MIGFTHSDNFMSASPAWAIPAPDCDFDDTAARLGTAHELGRLTWLLDDSSEND
jgi:hypothetical protein